MLYLLWGILNIGLFLFFIFLCFQATKLVRERVGMFAAFVFVIGLLSFMGQSDKVDYKEPGTDTIRKWKFASEDSVDMTATRSLSVVLEKTLISTCKLDIRYGMSKSQNRNTPINTYSTTEGFVSGTNWKPVMVSVNPTEDNTKFQYTVVGIVEWKLLAIRLYAQPKTYKGTVSIEKSGQ